jgi:hypothetical protein
MLGKLVAVVSGPVGVVITLAELVVAAGRVIEALQDDEEEES